MLIFHGVLVRNYYFEDQKFKGHMKCCFRKLCLPIAWNIDDYQKKCSFSILDIFGGECDLEIDNYEARFNN